MFSIFLLTAVCIGFLAWLYVRYQTIWKYIAKFPGPTAIPLFGNVLQIGFTPEDYLASLRRWCKEYDSKMFRLYGGPQPYIFLPDPKSVENLLSSTTLTYKADIYDYMRPWLGNGLLTSNGQTWAKHRKLITPSFHFQILQDFLHIINETTDRFMNLLGTFANHEGRFDFQEIVTLSTIDIICESAMGTRINTIEGNESPIAKAINDICFVIQERVFSALKRLDLIFYLTSDYRLQQKSLKILYEEFSKIITERRKILEKLSDNSKATNDDDFKRPKVAFLDNLLTAEVDGKPLTFQQIFEEVSTFMFEGHDTTASAITFAIFCLSRHPEIQEKASKEQYDLYGNDTQRNPTYQELQEMKYLECIIKETLRIFPSVPFIGRTTAVPTEFGGHSIPKGTTLIVPIISVGTSETNFEEPFVFRPERFDSDKRITSNPFDYVPFSAGPRNCIGQKFAMMELKVTLSKILRHFRILPAVDGLPSGIHDPTDPNDRPDNPFDPRLASLITLKSTNGVYVRLRKRGVEVA